MIERQPQGAGRGPLPIKAISSVRRLAVVRALFLGDLLLAVPGLRALRAGFPEAEITLIGLPWAESFVHRFGHYIDRFVEFAGYPGIDEVEVDVVRTATFLRQQRAYGYDLAVQMHGSGVTSNPFTLDLGARLTAGYYKDHRPIGLTVAAPYPEDQPEVVRNLHLARLLGCMESDPTLEFPLFLEERIEARRLLRDVEPGRLLVGIHPGAKAPSRRWPPECFAAVADDLVRRFEAQIVLTGGQGEEEIVRAVAERMDAPPLNLAGRTSLGGLGALIGKLDLLVSNDTGPVHIADALRIPTVTLFGPTDPRRWGPLDRTIHAVVQAPATHEGHRCSPGCGAECSEAHHCLRRITPEAVVAAAENLLTMGVSACSV
jgi:ADP-heptose:LPS heptosyltransferase